MNDIKLKPNNDGTFDWSFKSNDVNNVIGSQQIVSAVIHAIFLGYHESELYLYRDKGCAIKDNYLITLNDKGIELLQEIIKTTCKEVYNIKDAEVFINTSENDVGLDFSVKVITEDGKEVDINGI